MLWRTERASRTAALAPERELVGAHSGASRENESPWAAVGRSRWASAVGRQGRRQASTTLRATVKRRAARRRSLSGRRLTAPLGVVRGSLVPHPTAEEAPDDRRAADQTGWQIAALHDTVAELADTWDNGGGPDHEPTRDQLEQLTPAGRSRSRSPRASS